MLMVGNEYTVASEAIHCRRRRRRRKYQFAM
jgi:hypothetical protein